MAQFVCTVCGGHDAYDTLAGNIRRHWVWDENVGKYKLQGRDINIASQTVVCTDCATPLTIEEKQIILDNMYDPTQVAIGNWSG